MCERTCPNCGCTEHIEGYGIYGLSLYCNKCPLVLARTPDPDAAPINLTDDEATAWIAERSYVVEGAEADDPLDDEMFGPIRRPLIPMTAEEAGWSNATALGEGYL